VIRKPRYRHPAGEQIEIQWSDTPEAIYCHGHRTPAEFVDDVGLLLDDEEENAAQSWDEDAEPIPRISRDPLDWVVRHRWARWEPRQHGEWAKNMAFEVYADQRRGSFPVTEGRLVDDIVHDENLSIEREVAQIIDRNLVRACFPGAEYSDPSEFGNAFARYPGWYGVGEIWYRTEGVRDGNATSPRLQWVWIANGDHGYWCQIATGRIDGHQGELE
jgi:hypothetical protein